MFGINEDSLASIEFRLSWKKNNVNHTDTLYAHRVNFWRDLFPEILRRELIGSYKGDRVSQDYQPGDLVPLPDNQRTFRVPHRNVTGQRY